MRFNRIVSSALILSIVVLFAPPLSLASTLADPCGGPNALLNLLNRPSVADSSCVVPYRHVVIETGYTYAQFTHSSGDAYNYPQAVLRVGLPLDNEFVMLLPSYIHQSRDSVSGSTATSVGIKHEIGYNEKWLGSVESLFVLPSGSSAFGSYEVGAAINGIITYTFNQQLSATFMLGLVTLTAPSGSGGQRFTTTNPDLVLTYSLKDNVSLYAEVYGYTQPAPGLGFASAMDAGVLYLLTPSLAFDVEFGHRISGDMLGLNRALGAGVSFMF